MATLYVPDSKRRKKDREELALNAPSGPENRVNIIAQLEDAEGNPAGPQLDLPHDADPKQLEELNALCRTRTRSCSRSTRRTRRSPAPWASTCGRDASVETVLKIVYQPRRSSGVRPVTRCSSAIPGHAEAVLSVAFSQTETPRVRSGDTTVRFRNHETETRRHTCSGHANWAPLHRVVPRRQIRRERR